MDGKLLATDVRDAGRVPSPALIVVDMQNDFVRKGAPMEVPDARGTIAPILRLISHFRQAGRPIVFTRFVSGESENLLWLWSQQCQPPTRACWKGVRRAYADDPVERECAGIIEELRPQATDLVVDKQGYGAFHGTALDALLRRRGVASLVVVGTVTQICVEETGREAFHHGYRTTLVSDGVSSFAPDLHAATLKNFGMKFGWVADTDTVLQWL